MRVKARKRKVVPIIATVTIKNVEYRNNPRASAEYVKNKLYQILGRKVLEFCRTEIDFPRGDQEPVSVTAKIMVVDMGKDGVRRKNAESHYNYGPSGT